MALRPLEMTMMICSIPAATASSTAYWMIGRSTSGIISLGIALEAGRKRVPNPAAGRTALRTRTMSGALLGLWGRRSGRRKRHPRPHARAQVDLLTGHGVYQQSVAGQLSHPSAAADP